MFRRKQRSPFDQVSDFDRRRIVDYRYCGLSFREIGSRVVRNQTTVMRIWERWMQVGTKVRRGRLHPPQCTTLSEHTIQRLLQHSGLSTKRLLLGIPLTQNHKRLCHKWCDERRIWVAEWNEVVFIDESRICVQHHDRRIRVRRHRGERMPNRCVMHHHTGPAPGIMIELLPWPAPSRNFSTIENMGYMVAKRLNQVTPPAATPDQLWQFVEAAWSAVPQEHIKSLFESMPRRVAARISNNNDSYSGY
ncbi:transposable element Tcb1 transposase [Trichonephila clavipes]|nr:transposable element Tcb1 transposase [Trichonephila clavipes]